ncbi:ZinT family metal-binding protein [Salipaludibacillus sp. HK11]|uniref:ZinT family metal-binding protein n=1 Tax=Salipaludibacillus sp. HK11 TaxID=3394320 RepID=UPI0039FC36A2
MVVSQVKKLSVLALAIFVTVGCGTNNEEEAEVENNNSTSNEAVENTDEEENQSLNESNEDNHDHDNNDHNHDHDNEHNNNDNNHDHNHDHSHDHDDETSQIYDGYFEDDQIEDRPLSDWEGDWQSVYPYLLSGDLEEVFVDKAAESEEMTAEEYEEYYKVGYETNVERIVIEDDTFTFYEDGDESTSEYTYDGYEILEYEKGNRGVRFIFERTDESEDMPKYIQFSDHSIYPTKAHHFHLYWGDDRDELLEEVTNWPTYYPSSMDADDIVHEMIAH